MLPVDACEAATFYCWEVRIVVHEGAPPRPSMTVEVQTVVFLSCDPTFDDKTGRIHLSKPWPNEDPTANASCWFLWATILHFPPEAPKVLQLQVGALQRKQWHAESGSSRCQHEFAPSFHNKAWQSPKPTLLAALASAWNSSKHLQLAEQQAAVQVPPSQNEEIKDTLRVTDAASEHGNEGRVREPRVNGDRIRSSEERRRRAYLFSSPTGPQMHEVDLVYIAHFHVLPDSFMCYRTVSWVTPQFYALPHSFMRYRTVLCVTAQFLFVNCSLR
jgi:hypothetical protein